MNFWKRFLYWFRPKKAKWVEPDLSDFVQAKLEDLYHNSDKLRLPKEIRYSEAVKKRHVKYRAAIGQLTDNIVNLKPETQTQILINLNGSN